MFQPSTITGKLFKTYLKLPDHPAKIRIQNILGRQLFPKGIVLKNEKGVVLQLEANDWITRIILQEGYYENQTLQLATTLLKAGDVFMDVGSNFGLFSCYAGVGSGANIVAVDPNHQIIGRLLKNISLNKLERRVIILNMAITPTIEWVNLGQTSIANSGSTYTTSATNSGLAIFGCPLEYVCERLQFSSIKLIKIDIEGNEYEVLQHFPFEKINVENIIMEYNEHARIGFEALKMFFAGKGYKCLSVDGKQVDDVKQGITENNLWFTKN